MKELSVQELVSKLADGEKIQVVDIRGVQEHSDWQIPGSTNCPAYDAIGTGDTSLLTDFSSQLSKNSPVVAVCRGGVRSQTAVKIWQSLGLNALNLTGGMRAWSLASSIAEISNPGKGLDKAFQLRRNGKGCLSYMLISNKEAVVIDPSLEVETYLDLAKEHSAKINLVIETHVHADHISRGRSLAKTAEAEYLLPQNNRVTFKHNSVSADQEISFGKAKLKAIRTPGHTGESVCYLAGEDLLFTGDTIFTDNVGRPDLEKGDSGAEAGAQLLYKSLTQGILKLPPSTRIFPAHTGTAIGFDNVPICTTIQDLKSRLHLLSSSEADFVTQVVSRLTTKPGNFDSVIAINEGKLDLGGENPINLEAGPNRCAAC